MCALSENVKSQFSCSTDSQAVLSWFFFSAGVPNMNTHCHNLVRITICCHILTHLATVSSWDFPTLKMLGRAYTRWTLQVFYIHLELVWLLYQSLITLTDIFMIAAMNQRIILIYSSQYFDLLLCYCNYSLHIFCSSSLVVVSGCAVWAIQLLSLVSALRCYFVSILTYLYVSVALCLTSVLCFLFLVWENADMTL